MRDKYIVLINNNMYLKKTNMNERKKCSGVITEQKESVKVASSGITKKVR
jgi:hypothetical protein